MDLNGPILGVIYYVVLCTTYDIISGATPRRLWAFISDNILGVIYGPIFNAIFDVVSGAIYNTKFGATTNIPSCAHFCTKKGVQFVN